MRNRLLLILIMPIVIFLWLVGWSLAFSPDNKREKKNPQALQVEFLAGPSSDEDHEVYV